MATAPSTNPTGTEERKLTSRQRRIEEQRQKIETMRRQQRRKRATWGTGILAVFAAVAALVVTQVKPPTPAQGRQFPDEGRSHVATGVPVVYRTRPPTSGNHYAQPAGYQFYDQDIGAGSWLHALEHGAVALLYRPDMCSAECLTQVRQAYAATPLDGRYGVKKLVAAAYSEMDTAVAVVSWGWSDTMDAPDRDRIISFYREHVNRGPEDTP